MGNEYDLFLLNGFATYLLARTPVLPTFRIAFLCGFDPNNVGTTKSAKHIAANVLKILDRSDQACISSSSKPSDFIAFSSSPLVVLFFLFASSSSFSRGSNAGPTCHRAFIFGATENPPPFLFFSIFLFDDDDMMMMMMLLCCVRLFKATPRFVPETKSISRRPKKRQRTTTGPPKKEEKFCFFFFLRAFCAMINERKCRRL